MPARAGRRKESRYIRKGKTALFSRGRFEFKIQRNIYFGYFFLRLYFEYENGMINIIYKKIVTIQ